MPSRVIPSVLPASSSSAASRVPCYCPYSPAELSGASASSASIVAVITVACLGIRLHPRDPRSPAQWTQRNHMHPEAPSFRPSAARLHFTCEREAASQRRPPSPPVHSHDRPPARLVCLRLPPAPLLHYYYYFPAVVDLFEFCWQRLWGSNAKTMPSRSGVAAGRRCSGVMLTCAAL